MKTVQIPRRFAVEEWAMSLNWAEAAASRSREARGLSPIQGPPATAYLLWPQRQADCRPGAGLFLGSQTVSVW